MARVKPHFARYSLQVLVKEIHFIISAESKLESEKHSKHHLEVGTAFDIPDPENLILIPLKLSSELDIH